ncbi:MAG: D-alanyl-D-alanine carboxypeptidase family protein [Candidatus Dojkabacteria bacterium]|nr:D-alanyl-D-alanine carboxypeptidase family protein [Candidatus Dojkabacteria bacterium]
MDNRVEIKINKTSRPPKIILIVFGFLFLLIFSSIYSQLRNNGINPFGQFNDVFAQFVGRPAPNVGELLANLQTGDSLEESLDRCEIIDPNRKDASGNPQVMSVKDYNQSNPIAVESMAGLNLGDKGFSEEYYEYMFQMGMSYNLSVFVDPGSASSAAEYVKTANENEVVPIVRICYVGNCNFKSPGQVVSFFEQVSVLSGPGNDFIAIVGPNEPGTGTPSEMSGFIGSENYDNMINFTLEAAKSLQRLRVINGGNMYLSPAAFNLTNAQANDAAEYLNHPSSSQFPKLFDYMMGNTYALGYPPAQDPELGEIAKAYDWYRNGADGVTGLGDWSEENNMPVIITEFGILKNGISPIVQTAEAKQAFEEFCNDPMVEGVLFFRPLPGVGSQQEEHQLFPGDLNASIQGIIDIIGDCEKNSGNRDYAWQACNLDSCLYEQTYDDRSVASTCGIEYEREEISESNGPALLINCSGGLCTTGKVDTLEIKAPIKQFGSNASVGTENLPYIPACVQAISTIYGAQGEYDSYDPFNQFAGEITYGSSTNPSKYPMPWLGNAINCSAALLALDLKVTDYVTPGYEINFNPGSSAIQSLYEQYSEEYLIQDHVDPNHEMWPLNYFEDTKGKLLDERALCLDGDCFDKESDTWAIKQLREYLPSQTSNTYVRVDQCEKETMPDYMTNEGAKVMRYRDEPANYVIGPEVVLGENDKVWEGTENRVCLDFSTRNIDENSLILTEDPEEDESVCINLYYVYPDSPEIYIRDPGTEKEADCSLIEAGLIRCTNGEIADVEAFNRGDCQVQAPYQACYGLAPGSKHEIYRRIPDGTASFASVPEIEIPGMYDALYSQYMRLRTELARTGQQIIFRENIGMKLEVSTKIRDMNRKYDLTPYYYDQVVTDNNGEAQCSVPKLIGNKYYLGKSNPVYTTNQYFDWLGYLDILQEFNVVYIGSPLPMFEIKGNPFYLGLSETIEEGVSEERLQESRLLYENEFFLYSGAANQLISFPLMTCDELLASKYDAGADRRSNPDLDYTCLTFWDDPRFKEKDDLGNFLCEQGYVIPGLCDDASYCPSDYEPVDPAFGTGDYICPTDLAYCLQGPYGSYSHATNSLNAYDVAGNVFIAPFDGEVIKVQEKFPYCDEGGAAGGAIWYSGNVNGQTVTLFVLHVNTFTDAENNTSIDPSSLLRKFKSGETIAKMSKIGDRDVTNTDCIGSPIHIHVELANGPGDTNAAGDITSLFLDTFGCKITSNSSSSCTNRTENTYSGGGSNESQGGDSEPESFINTDMNLFPVSRERQILDCREPESTIAVPLSSLPSPTPPYFQEGATPLDNTSNFKLTPEASNALITMLTEMEDKDPEAYSTCGFNWGYRSAVVQASFSDECTVATACACHSEHQLGTTVDFRPASGASVNSFGSTGCYDWLQSNAATYGFVQSYTQGNPDYIAEVWHWRWLLGDTANEFLSQKNQSDGQPYLRVYLENELGIESFETFDSDDNVYAQLCSATDPWDDDLNSSSLSCSIDGTDSSDALNPERARAAIESRVRAYNLDTNILTGEGDNRSFAWIALSGIPGGENLTESLSLRLSQIEFYGSEENYQRVLGYREEVTRHFFSEVNRVGINPRLAYTLWIEETGFSAVGSVSLGCRPGALSSIPRIDVSSIENVLVGPS